MKKICSDFKRKIHLYFYEREVYWSEVSLSIGDIRWVNPTSQNQGYIQLLMKT